MFHERVYGLLVQTDALVGIMSAHHGVTFLSHKQTHLLQIGGSFVVNVRMGAHVEKTLVVGEHHFSLKRVVFMS